MATATAAIKEIFAALPHIKRTGAKHLWLDRKLDNTRNGMLVNSANRMKTSTYGYTGFIVV